MAIVSVQRTSADDATATVHTLTLSATTAGSTILVGMRVNNTLDDSQVSTLVLGAGGANRTFSRVRRQFGIGTVRNLECWILENAAGGETVITLTLLATFIVRWGAVEVTGCQTSSSVDGSNSTSNTGTALDSGSVTATTSTGFLFCIGASELAETFTLGTNFLNLATATRYGQEERILSAAGSYNGVMSIGASDNWSCMAVAVKGPASAGLSGSLLEMQFSSGVWTDVTADVRGQDPIVCMVGTTERGVQACISEPGTLTFVLENSSLNSGGVEGYYSPLHTSKRSGFDFHIPVRWTLLDASGTSTVRFVGRLVDIDPDAGANGPRATRCQAQDAWGTWAETNVSGLTTQLNKRSDQLVDLVLPADPDYTVFYSVVDSSLGLSTFPVAFDTAEDEATTIREELFRIAVSEGAHLFFEYFDVKPNLVHQNRDHHWLNPQVDWTLTSLHGLDVSSARDDVAYKVQGTCYPTTTDTAATTVLYSLGSATTLIQPGQVNTALFGPYRDPANPSTRIGGTAQVNPVVTTDYTMNAASDGSGADLSANFTVTAAFTSSGVRFTITNGGTTAGYVTKLQVRGKGIYRTPTVFEATAQPANYGIRTLTFSMPYQGDATDGRELVERIAALEGSPLQRVRSVRVAANASGYESFALNVNIRDRIRLTDTQTGVSGTFLVNGIQHEFQLGAIAWITLFVETDAMAAWTTPTYAAGNFTTNGAGGWTVDAGDVSALAWVLIGKTMTVSFHLVTTTVTAATGTELRIAIPASQTAKKAMDNPMHYIDNGTHGTGLANVAAAGTYISLQTATGAAWTASVNNTSVFGQLTFEVT